MNQQIIEKLKHISNTQYQVCIGEQSIKRRKQFQHYIIDVNISNTKLSNHVSYPGNPGPWPGNNFTSNIMSSINTVIYFFKTLVFNEFNNPDIRTVNTDLGVGNLN